MDHDHFVTPLEVKFSGGDGEPMTFSGYGARFGNVDSYGDVIAPGAFTKTLATMKAENRWPAMLSQHGGMGFSAEDMTPVGVWTALRQDDVGLHVEGRLADTQRGRDLYALMKMSPRPAIDGMSIGYRATEWVMRSKPEEPRRTLKAVDLLEVSLVTFPANGKARVESVKGLAARLAPDTLREIEAAFRDEGLSRADAVKAVAGLKAWLRRDAGVPEPAPRDEAAAVELRSMAARIRALAPSP